MDAYTIDAVALIRYLVDELPGAAEAIFEEAEKDECVLQLPTIAAVETLYRVEKRERIMDVPIEASANDLVEALDAEFPLRIVGADYQEITALAGIIAELSIHDAMIVASHRVQDTEAILTNDPEIEALGVETIWN